MKVPCSTRAVRKSLALTMFAILAMALSSVHATGQVAAELQIRLDQASRALADCTVAAAKMRGAELTHENIDRYVIGACAEAHGNLVELSWGLPTPEASRILLVATVDALDAARRTLARRTLAN